MKNLIFINGTMGVGKTATSQRLHEILQPSLFLDGDWCWSMNPFVVNEENKKMVMNNIIFLLKSFLQNSQNDTIIFCWVMHEESIIEEIVTQLNQEEFKLFKFSIMCSEAKLISNFEKDIRQGKRNKNQLNESIRRLAMYRNQSTMKIYTDGCSIDEVAMKIKKIVKG